MAHEIPVLPFTLNASEAIAIYRFVNVTTTGEAELADDGTDAIGVSQNDPAIDEACAIEVYGLSICEAGEAIAAQDYITSDATGRGKTATTGERIHGVALTAAGAAGEYFTVLLRPVGVLLPA
jgi:hypothetical protein